MKPTHFHKPIPGFLAGGGKLAAVLVCLLFAHVVLAQVYINNNNNFYTIPGSPPPPINDPAFDNQSIFSVSYNNFIFNNIQYCEPWVGTLFYTNNGEMMVNAPITLTGANLDEDTTGVGFQFDLQTTNGTSTNSVSSMAGTFYNPGTIHADSILDGNNVVNEIGEEFFFQTSIGACLISATNIMVPSGTIEVGLDGLLSLNGQTVDLTRSSLTMETAENEGGLTGDSGFTGGGIFGLNTNALWFPSTELTPTNAISAFFPILPFELVLTNSVPYNQQAGLINRSVFIQDTSPTNVVYGIYYGPGITNILGGGDVTIGWTGTYLDYANGTYLTNYLYLNNNYELGASTNVEFSAQGYPNNYTITESQTPLIFGPVPSAMPTFPAIGITNAYSYGTFESDSLSFTNQTVSNPSGALTNLPNQIDITASRELNLTLAQIAGPIYVSFMATNQYDGSGGAQIQTPLADINLGVTNGNMSVSNLLEPQIPFWNGTILAWDTEFFNVTSNVLGTVTNDYRVLLVQSQLLPTTTPLVHNLTLNATNSLTINDVLNTYGSVYATPVSLTFATNIIATGAESPDGELNVESSSFSWSGSFPNLLWLTNSGAIRLPTFNYFISTSNGVSITPPMPALAATNLLSETIGTNVTHGTITIGQQSYVFTNTVTSGSTNSVKIGVTFDASLTNLVAAINGSAGAGTLYSSSLAKNGFAAAGSVTTNHNFVVSAYSTGPSGDVIPVASSATNLTWLASTSTLIGGTNVQAGVTNTVSSSVPYGAIINNTLLTDQGASMWVNNFQNGGAISNGVGSFSLNAVTATFTNGSLTAGGDISLTANTLVMSNLFLQAGRSLTLEVTNLITDDAVTNGSVWSVGSTNATGFDGLGLVLPMVPTNTTPGVNGLLGTTIYMQSPPPSKEVFNYWAATNDGVSVAGYSNNVAIGQLIVDSLAPSSDFYFGGTGSNNAIYVDRLELDDFAAYTNVVGNNTIPTLLFNTNLVIYYADAVSSAQDVSYELNGANGGHLQWVPEYTGFFSSTNLVYPNGTTNTLNAGLVNDPQLDSNGNGTPNNTDPDPIFVPSEVDFKFALTNVSSTMMALLTWNSIPSSTNDVLYTTNFMSTNWVVVTNFVSPSAAPPPGGWPITNAIVEPLHMTVPHGYYRVRVIPDNATEY